MNSERITRWFHSRNSDDMSPSTSVFAVMNKFANDVEQKGLNLTETNQRFYNLLCEATCALYRAQREGKRVVFTRRVRNPPPGWTKPIESMWMDHLETMIFSDTYWENFWRSIGKEEAIWEYAVPDWRNYMQFVMLNCVQRDMYLLEDEGLIAKTDDGDFVKAEEYDPPEYDDE